MKLNGDPRLIRVSRLLRASQDVDASSSQRSLFQNALSWLRFLGFASDGSVWRFQLVSCEEKSGQLAVSEGERAALINLSHDQAFSISDVSLPPRHGLLVVSDVEWRRAVAEGTSGLLLIGVQSARE